MNEKIYLCDSHSHLHEVSLFDEDIIYFLPSSIPSEIKLLTNLKKNKKNIYIGGALHPFCTDEKYENEIEILHQSIVNNEIDYIGEIGLDKLIDLSLDKQKEIFVKQIELVEKYSLTVNIHCVRQYNEIFNLLKGRKLPKIIFHSFNSSKEEISRFIKYFDCYFSISPVIYKSSKLQEVIKFIPLEKFLLETDYPYLNNFSPFKSHIEILKDLYKFIANILKIKEGNFKEIIFNNIKEIIKEFEKTKR